MWESVQARGSVNQGRENTNFEGGGLVQVGGGVSVAILMAEEVGEVGGRNGNFDVWILGLVLKMIRGRKTLVASAVRAKKVMAKVPWRTASGWRTMGFWRRRV